MIGSVYCILFSDGTLKAGVTFGEQHKRIRSHFQSAKAFGLKAVVALFSEMHEGAESTEKKLLKFLSERLRGRSPEYFFGADINVARSAMLSTGKLVAWTREPKTANGCLLVPPGLSECLTDTQKSKKKTIEERIINLVQRNNKNGITRGVIQNRFRNQEVDSALESLVASGDLLVEKFVHPKKQDEIERYFASKNELEARLLLREVEVVK